MQPEVQASRTPNADLVAYARERGVTLTDRGARKMRAALGDERARARVDALESLMDLAGALGVELGTLPAIRRLDAAAGDYDVAAARLVEDIRSRRQRVLDVEWSRLERQHYASEARARHAALQEQLAVGTLGTRCVLLLAAAEDAGLASPDAKAYELRLGRIVGVEIETRFPDEEWRVFDGDSTDHREVVDRFLAAERQVRIDFLRRHAAMQQRIDAFADSARLHRDVERVLLEIRGRLADRVSEGWCPNPDLYRQRVIEAAAEAARRAAA